MLHPAHRVGPIAAFEPLYLALAQLQHSQSPSLAETLSDSSPPSLEGDRISLQLGGDIILEHLHHFLSHLTPMLAGWHDGWPRAYDIPPAFSGLIFGSRARASRSSTVGAAPSAPHQ